MSEDNDSMTEEQAKEMLREFSESKSNIHSFFTNIIKAKSTTRVGNLSETELGHPKLPQRSLKELALISYDIINKPVWAKFFNDMAEIQTATSLSKDAILIKLSVTSKKELADTTPAKKVNKGWFAKKS